MRSAYAATSTVPMLAATAVEKVSDPRRATVRTNSGPPVRASAPTDGPSGRMDTCRSRTARTIRVTYTPAPMYWASTVASADAPMPKPSPLISASSNARLKMFVPTATARGVTVSCMPRR